MKTCVEMLTHRRNQSKWFISSNHHRLGKQNGFTLIELMVVVGIIAILAAIAIPSYRRYVVMNAEKEAQAKMKQFQLQLEGWRASRLTYKGFVPRRGNGICASGNYCYNVGTTGIYVPEGSTAANYKYLITLVDSSDTTKSLKVSGSGVNTAIGRGWKMLAVPNSNGNVSSARTIMLSSAGVQCMASGSITIASPDCSSGTTNEEQW